jgi:sulfoxide reductase heme-binding subunit YedZ
MSTSTAKPDTTKKSWDPWESAGAIALVGGAGLLLALVLAATTTGLSVSPAIWYIARAAGMTTYLLLWLSVITGLGLTTRLLGFLGDQGIVMQLHRMAADLSIAGVAIHLLAVAVDPTVRIGMLGALVPMTSAVRQPWTDLGIVAAYGLVGITVSFAARRWIGKDRWRALHYLTFGFWALALLHAIGAGTDSGTLWAGAIYTLTATSVVFLLAYRIFQSRAPAPAPRRAARRLDAAESST